MIGIGKILGHYQIIDKFGAGRTWLVCKVALEEVKEESDSGALEAAGAPGATVRGKIWWASGLKGIGVVACLWGKSYEGAKARFSSALPR